MKINIQISKDRRTGALQLSIGDSNGGYRIAGPKFCGESPVLLTHDLSKLDAKEMKKYLDKVLGDDKPVRPSRQMLDEFKSIRPEVCDACACGGNPAECKQDVYETIIDGCGRPLTYCSKSKKEK